MTKQRFDNNYYSPLHSDESAIINAAFEDGDQISDLSNTRGVMPLSNVQSLGSRVNYKPAKAKFSLQEFSNINTSNFEVEWQSYLHNSLSQGLSRRRSFNSVSASASSSSPSSVNSANSSPLPQPLYRHEEVPSIGRKPYMKKNQRHRA